MILSFLRVYIGRSKYSGKISSYIFKFGSNRLSVGKKMKDYFI